MIAINLLPEELKLSAKTNKFNLQNLLYSIPVLFFILIIAHIYLIIVSLGIDLRLRALNNKWKTLEPKRKAVETINNEYKIVAEDSSIILHLLKERRNWAESLNILSRRLAPGIWFNEISVSNNNFTLKGSVISFERQELNLLDKFLNTLKSEKNFFKNFNNLELSNVQREYLGGYEVISFALNGSLK